MLDSENCTKIVYLVVKHIGRLTKRKIMFFELVTIFISRILYVYHIEINIRLFN